MFLVVLILIDVQIDELTISNHSPLRGKTVRELEIRGKGAFIIVALRRSNGELLTHPLIVLGHQEELPKFARYYKLNHYLYPTERRERILK